MYSRAPKRDGVCDHCGTELDPSSDDREDLIQERFRHYRDEDLSSGGVLPEDWALFIRLTACGRIAEVTREILAIIDGEEMEGDDDATKWRKGIDCLKKTPLKS